MSIARPALTHQLDHGGAHEFVTKPRFELRRRSQQSDLGALVDRTERIIDPRHSCRLTERFVLVKDRQRVDQGATAGPALPEPVPHPGDDVRRRGKLGLGTRPYRRRHLLEQRQHVSRVAESVPGQNARHRRMKNPSASCGEFGDRRRTKALHMDFLGGDVGDGRVAIRRPQHDQQRCVAMIACHRGDGLQGHRVGIVGIIDDDEARPLWCGGVTAGCDDARGETRCGIDRVDGDIPLQKLSEHRAWPAHLPRRCSGPPRATLVGLAMLVNQPLEQRALAHPRHPNDHDGVDASGHGRRASTAEFGEFVITPNASRSHSEHRHIVVAGGASSAEVATRDGKHCAGDVGRLLGRQEADGRGLFVEGAVPLQQ